MNGTSHSDCVSIWQFTKEPTLVRNLSLVMCVVRHLVPSRISTGTGKHILTTDVTNAVTVTSVSFKLQTWEVISKRTLARNHLLAYCVKRRSLVKDTFKSTKWHIQERSPVSVRTVTIVLGYLLILKLILEENMVLNLRSIYWAPVCIYMYVLVTSFEVDHVDFSKHTILNLNSSSRLNKMCIVVLSVQCLLISYTMIDYRQSKVVWKQDQLGNTKHQRSTKLIIFRIFS